MHEAQRFLALLASIGEGHMHVAGQLAVIGVEDMPEHVATGPSAAERDECGAFDAIWVQLTHYQILD
jgi:hypothetical protein